MADWHPIESAVENPAGVWAMVAPDGREYGRIELRRVNGGELRYKVTRDGVVLGWASTLREACYRVHMVFLAAHGPGGGSVSDWGELTGRERRKAPSNPA
ncbi:hypothetical protein J2Y46_002626 [Microbacterium sp. BE35]|uniref:hypothetical protein n=1 Tax=Microbacterium sp. BE35 TaxID=2817773 RepID=UPI00285BF445|nr:hypothetical protein [Microbacterium sp. BE35]MDR7189800.1 hypothetical protein [Microbacterium sp. BE35]